MLDSPEMDDPRLKNLGVSLVGCLVVDDVGASTHKDFGSEHNLLFRSGLSERPATLILARHSVLENHQPASINRSNITSYTLIQMILSSTISLS